MEVINFLAMSVLLVVTAAVDQEEVAGTNVTLECRLVSTVTFPTWKGPPSSAVYLREGEESNANYSWVSYGDDSRSLVITDVQPEHSGDYTCEKDGNAAETISLNVLAKPTVQLENKVSVIYGSFARSRVITGIEDKNITLTCTASGANPRPLVDIVMPENTTINDIKTTITSSGNTYTVRVSGTFLPDRNSDRKEIVCKAINPTPTNKLGDYTMEDRADVFLKLTPSYYGTMGTGNVVLGKNLTMSCDASLARPAATISWLFDGQPIDTSRFLVGATTEVPDQATETMGVIKNVTLVGARKGDNRKILACSVEHEALETPYIPHPSTVTVAFGPDYVNITGNNRTFAGDDATLTLTCSTASMGGVEPTNTIISWKNETDKKVIENAAKLTLTDGEFNGKEVSQDLTINVTRYMDGQRITCAVDQQDKLFTEVTATATLDIDYPPIITEPEDDVVRFAEHDNATLKCSAKSKPVATFTWYNESNVPLQQGSPEPSDRNEYSLRWTDIGYDAAGKYKCVATTGQIGYKDERVVEVVITESPKLPSEFTFTESGTDALTVSFTPPSQEPDIYQSYYLQYRSATGNNSSPWHEVSLLAGANSFKLNNLKYGTEYNVRIKVVNKYGSTRYTGTHNLKTQDVTLEDGITRKDLDIAIAVSVVVTAVVIIIIVAIICVCWRKRMCGSSSEKFELQDR